MGHASRVLIGVGLSAFVATASCPSGVVAQSKPADAKGPAGATKPTTRPAKPGDVPEVNRKVIAFRAEQLGKKVADGECANLVNEAYKAAGAKRNHDVPAPAGVTLREDDYVWGRLLGPKDPVLPGDVIQFRDVVIKQRVGSRTTTNTMSHHTAVVRSVIGRNYYAILHQNTGGSGVPDEKRKTVQAATLNLNYKTSGEVWIYRPLSLEEGSADKK